MLSLILGFITGLAGPISQTVNNITELKKIRAQTESDIRRKEIDQQISENQDKKAILLAEAGRRVAGTLNAVLRTIAASGPIAYVTKIFFWDKTVGAFVGCTRNNIEEALVDCTTFTTDPLDPYLWGVVTVVLGFYFLATSWTKK